MPRRIRTEQDRRQAASAQWAPAKLRRLRAELRAEWRSGQVKSIDTISLIRAVEQSHLTLKQLRERRREQTRVHRRGMRQAA